VNASTLADFPGSAASSSRGSSSTAATTKIQAELQFASAIAAYRLLPDAWLLPVATYLPWLEVILAC